MLVKKRKLLRMGIAGAFASATLGIFAAPASADFGSGPAFDGYAQGNALDATASNQTLPLGLVAEGVGPEASSHMTSYGQADGEASFPYLGTVVPGLPGVLGALYGLPVPSYPLQATSQSNSAPDDVNYPGIDLHAESGASSTVGTANVGSDAAGGGQAGARIDVDSSGDVTSTATTAVNGLKLGGLVSLTGVSSQAIVEADGSSGMLTRTSNFSIGQISAPGLSITVPPTTPGNVPIPIPVPGLPQLPATALPTIPLPFAGQTLPTPDIGFENGNFNITLPGFPNEKFAIPADTVLAAFKALGIDMSYQPATNTPTGITGATFTFGYTVVSPPANMYFSGPTPVTFTVGSAIANVTLSPTTDDSTGDGSGGDTLGGTSTAPLPTTDTSLPSPSDAASSAPVTTTTGTTPTSTGTAPVAGGTTPVGADGGATSGSSLPASGGDATTASVPAPITADAPSGSTSSTVAPTTGGTRTVALSRPTPSPIDLSDIYLAFVLVAAAALTSMTTLRLLGVRTLWSS